MAAYLRYLTGFDERGQAYAIEDALAPELQRRAREGGKDPRNLLACRALFGDDLLQHHELVAELGRLLAGLYDEGVRATLRRVMSDAVQA